MAVYAANIVIEQGYDFYTNFELEDAANNQPKNLVGYGVTAQVRKTYSSTNSVSFASSIANASNGVISISLTSTQTSALKPGRYVYDVELVSNTLTVERIVEGIVTIYPEATK